MQLFERGMFTLHSGAMSDFKIDCDFLSDESIACIAGEIHKKVGDYDEVVGIPTGGTRLAKYLDAYIPRRSILETGGDPWAKRGPRLFHIHTVLIVDDVLTTGKSMEEERKKHLKSKGAVIFARGPCPEWIMPLFTLHGNETKEQAQNRKIAQTARKMLDSMSMVAGLVQSLDGLKKVIDDEGS